jgi:hypothetical protein
MKNIGSSFFSSSCPKILKALEAKFGVLQVVSDIEQDTHHLVLKGEIILASHPNGYSCHELATRLISGDVKRSIEQAEYIVRCGGTAKENSFFSDLLKQ